MSAIAAVRTRAPVASAPVLHRRASDSLGAGSRVRYLIASPNQSEHMQGWVAYGMSQRLPDDASIEMRAGYDEARSRFISISTSADSIVLVKP